MQMGHKPLVTSHTHPIRPSEGLPQPGGCSTIKQMHTYLCEIKELQSAHVGDAELRATRATSPLSKAEGMQGAASGAELLSALLLPGDSWPASDSNIFHRARLNSGGSSIWCVLQASSDLERGGVSGLRLVVNAAELHMRPSWEREVLAALVPTWSPPSLRARKKDASAPATYSFGRIFQIQPRVLGTASGAPAFRYFELDRASDPLLQRLPRAVLSSLRVWPRPPPERHVLVVQRSHTRRFGGARTGLLLEVLDALCAEGVIVRNRIFDKASLHEQVSLAASASVFVSPHGAHLTNAMWMAEGSALVEIILRGAACACDPPPTADRAALPGGRRDAPHACDCGPGYYKADYANLAHTFGVRWFYWDPVRAYPLSCVREMNPIGCKLLLVDAPRLAAAASYLHRDQATERLVSTDPPPTDTSRRQRKVMAMVKLNQTSSEPSRVKRASQQHAL